MRRDAAPEAAPDAHGDDRLKAALSRNADFVVLATEPNAASLEAAIAGLDPEQVATIRIGNPLTSPLSVERAMLQLAPEDYDQDRPVLDGARRLLRAVTACAAGRPCLLVVVEQAETLTASALALLQLLPGLQAPGVARVRVAFVGAPAFHALLEDPRFHAIRDHSAEPPAADAAKPRVPDGVGVTPATPAPSAHRPPGKGRVVAVLGAASVAVAVLLAAALRPSRTPPVATAPMASPALGLEAPAWPPPPRDEVSPPTSAVIAAAVPPAPAAYPAAEFSAYSPAEAAPEAAPPPLAPSAVAEDPAAARELMFREFDAFVKARGLGGRLSRSDREALFQEYLVRRHTAAVLPSAQAAATGPEATAASDLPEVLLFFQASAPGAEALADQSAAMLRHQVRGVTVRPVPDVLPDPIIKYFRPEDRDLALAVAVALPPAATDWQVMDMSGAAGQLARATIEVWLPRPPASL